MSLSLSLVFIMRTEYDANVNIRCHQLPTTTVMRKGDLLVINVINVINSVIPSSHDKKNYKVRQVNVRRHFINHKFGLSKNRD